MIPSRVLVTSVRCEQLGGHDHLSVWVRGGKAGDLIVNAGDGIKLASRLLPDAPDVTEELNAAGQYTRSVSQ